MQIIIINYIEQPESPSWLIKDEHPFQGGFEPPELLAGDFNDLTPS